jgi:serine/threonine-protein kinase
VLAPLAYRNHSEAVRPQAGVGAQAVIGMDKETPQSPFDPGSVIAGKYRVERTIAEGGMGYVVAATHLSLDQPVALKFLRGDVANGLEPLARFTREAKAAAQLRSEYVARVLDAGATEDGTPYIAMEYLEGESLARVLQQKGPMEVANAVEYVIQACEALAEAHARGIVHRDIKPYNLYLVERAPGRRSIKVLDFGISKFAFSDPGNIVTGAIIGSPCYMSPEQLRSSASVDHRTDIWSLGVTLHELLVGVAPFDASLTLPEIVTAILDSSPPRLDEVRRGVPSELASVVQRCLAKDREVRFASAGDLAMSLLPFAPPRARVAAEQALSLRPVFPVRSAPAEGASAPEREAKGGAAREVAAAQRVETPVPDRETTGPQATPVAVTIPPPRPPIPSDPDIAPTPLAARAWVIATLVAAAGVVAFVAVSLAGREEKPAGAPSALSSLSAAVPEATGSAPRVELSPIPTASAPVSDRVELTVRAEPSQARILVDGEQVENPFHGSYPRANPTHHIVARAWGYETKSEDVHLTSDMIISIALDRNILPAPMPAAVAKPAPRRPPPPVTPSPEPESPTAAAGQAVDPSGGHVPVRPIDTKDPYGR